MEKGFPVKGVSPGIEDVIVMECDFSSCEHRDAVLSLLNCYAEGITGGGTGLSEFARAHLVEELHGRKAIHTVLAFIQNKAVGLAVAMEGFSTFACRPLLNIHDLVVDPSCRGRGISRLILEKLEEIALGMDCCKLTLEVLEGNGVAINLYRSFGFSNYELDPRMGRALFLEKKLT